jgi:hypothetical protein
LIDNLFPTFEIDTMAKDLMFVSNKFGLLQVSCIVFASYDPLRTSFAFQLASGYPIEVVFALFC